MLQACDKYHEAWQLYNSSHAALYNWGVALSDMAHLEKQTEEDTAYHCLLAAAEKYALSLFYSANNPQVSSLFKDCTVHHRNYSNCPYTELPLPSKRRGWSPLSLSLTLQLFLQRVSIILRRNCLQALNNWGLVLQELSTMRTPTERVLLVQQSVAKFRRAIRLRPEFDRACYNLGTVYYAHACSLQNEAQNQVCAYARNAYAVMSS